MLRTGAAQCLMVSKLDRLARSMADVSYMLGLATQQGWSLVALDLGVDTTTAEGRLVVGIMASIAEWEHARISERITEGLQEAKARGAVLGAKQRYSNAVAADVYDMRTCEHAWKDISTTLAYEGVLTKAGKPLSGAQLSLLYKRGAALV